MNLNKIGGVTIFLPHINLPIKASWWVLEGEKVKPGSLRFIFLGTPGWIRKFNLV